MENPCTLIAFGDSITKGYAPILEARLKKEFPEINLTMINAGVTGETSREGLVRMQELVDQKPNIVVIGFGMNDWRKGVDTSEYRGNLIKMIDAFEAIGARVILMSVPASYNFKKKKYNIEVDTYSNIVRELAYCKKVKCADVNELWKREVNKPQEYLHDELHPDYKNGYKLIVKCLMWYVTRKYTTVLWQYNGREAKCNYRCPYCYYLGLHSPQDMSFGDIEDWYKSFKNSFGNQYLVVYLGFGEPTLGKMFPKIIEMFEKEPKWELRVISNLDTHMAKKSAESKLAKEGRYHLAGSFHPAMITREKYLDLLLYFREKGLEVPSVYVGYPDYLSHFEDDINFFRKHGFVMHVRRLQGQHYGKIYPEAYTEEERILLARYMDDNMLKHMHSGVTHNGDLTFNGVHFFIMDNVGNIGYDSNWFPLYTEYRCIFGNLLQGNFKPLLLPGKYPGLRQGTDDGVANLIKHNMKELEGNHIACFGKQGNVYKDDNGGVVYGNEFKDFTDIKIRYEYNFPARNIVEKLKYKLYDRKNKRQCIE